jgi:hypothetical protein
MWEHRRLTTLWASTACYRDSFTFTFTFLLLLPSPVLVLTFSSTLYQNPSISVRPWGWKTKFHTHTKLKPLTNRNSWLIYVTFELSSHIQQLVSEPGVQRADRLTLPFHTHEPDLHVRYVQHKGISPSTIQTWLMMVHAQTYITNLYGIILKSSHLVELLCRKRAAGWCVKYGYSIRSWEFLRGGLLFPRTPLPLPTYELECCTCTISVLVSYLCGTACNARPRSR